MTKRERWLIYGLMALAMLITVVPPIWMIITSFKIQAESIAFSLALLPANPGFQAYGKTLRKVPLDGFYFSSIVSALVIVILQTLIAVMTTYSFSRLRLKGRDVLSILCISVLMAPGQISLISQLLTVEKIGLLNSTSRLVLPGLFSIHSTLLLRQSLLPAPEELKEAVIMGGYNHLIIFLKIMLPLTEPRSITYVITNGLWGWNNLVWPSIADTSMDKMTLPVRLALLSGRSGVEYPMLMAGMLLAAILMLLLYIFSQRYSTRGIAGVGIKGQEAVSCRVFSYKQ